MLTLFVFIIKYVIESRFVMRSNYSDLYYLLSTFAPRCLAEHKITFCITLIMPSLALFCQILIDSTPNCSAPLMTSHHVYYNIWMIACKFPHRPFQFEIVRARKHCFAHRIAPSYLRGSIVLKNKSANVDRSVVLVGLWH
jgi:hypothetical protein